MKIYTVRVITSGWFTGNFKEDKLTDAINEYAEKGWTVKCITTTNAGGQDMIIIVFEGERL